MPNTDIPRTTHEQELRAFSTALAKAEDNARALRQALTWCVVNHGETLGDHPKLLERFREILGMEGESDG